MRWQHPRAVRRLERVLAKTTVGLPLRVPTGDGLGSIPRSCSLNSLSQLAEPRCVDMPPVLRVDESVEASFNSRQQRSLSASDLGNVIRIA